MFAHRPGRGQGRCQRQPVGAKTAPRPHQQGFHRVQLLIHMPLPCSTGVAVHCNAASSVPSAAPRLPELARRANPRRAGDAAPRPAPDAGTRRCARSVPARGGRLPGFQNPASGSRPRAATRAAQKRPARQAGPEKCCRRYAAPTASIRATHCASPTFPDSKTCPGNTRRSTRAGCCPDSERMSSGTSCGVSNTSTPAGCHTARDGRPTTAAGHRRPAQVGRRCGPRNRQCHAIGDEPASRRIRPQGLHGLGARAATRQPSRPTSRPARGGIFQPRSRSVTPRVHRPVRTMWQRTGTGVTSRPPPSANRLSAVATSCHAASQSMDSAGRPQGLGRLQQLTHGARAFLRNLRYPPPRQARGADTTLRVRIIRACPAPLSTWTWRLMRKPENGGGIATVVSARTCTSRASPNQSLRKDWLAADADPPRATCDAAQATPLRTSCKDMACPRAAVMAALRLELPSCMAASCARPRPSAACSNNVSKDSNSTDSIKACPRCAASGRHVPHGLPSWPSSAGPAAASRACQYGRNKVASSSRPSGLGDGRTK